MQGGSLRGGTDRNVAELLCLLCHVSYERGDLAGARRALERELPLRRTREQEGAAAATLVNLGRACMQLGDWDVAEGHLSEAEDLLQSLAGAGAGVDRSGLREALWVHAECAEQRGDIDVALAKLRRLTDLLEG